MQLLADLFAGCGPPDHIRPDNSPELTANAVRKLFSRIGGQVLFIERGSPWVDGYNESFNGKLRNELLNRETFYKLMEMRVIVVAGKGGLGYHRNWANYGARSI